MTRDEIWTAAMAAGDATMMAGGRTDWSAEDWEAMVAEFNRLAPDLAEMSLEELRTEVNRRTAMMFPKPKNLRPCVHCSRELSARERMKPCPHCGAKNPR